MFEFCAMKDICSNILLKVHDDSDKRRDSITETNLDLAQCRSVFETKMIDAHVTDFSDRIDRLGQTYETYEVKETIPNKLSRIRRELEELEDEIDGDVNNEDEVKALQDLFARLNKKTKDKKLTVLNDLEKAESDDIKGKTMEVTDPEKMVKLDKRINQLEKSIGDEHTDKSIQTMINDLFRKFKVLSNDNDSLNKISSIIDEVNLKFEKSITTRRSLDNVQNEIDEDTKINEIYTKFVKTQDFADDLPFLIKRLESLNEVHIRVANSVNFTESMEQDITTIAKDLESWESSLNNLETQLTTLATTFDETKKKSYLIETSK